jgi:hypothetical protein
MHPVELQLMNSKKKLALFTSIFKIPKTHLKIAKNYALASMSAQQLSLVYCKVTLL